MFHFLVWIKPCCGGSSVGVSIVNMKKIQRALTDAFSHIEDVYL